MHGVILAAPARRFLGKADRRLYRRVAQKLRALSENPFPSDTKRVVGRKEKVFRVRVGGYRILYVVIQERKELLIVDIDKRGRAFN